MRKMTRLFVATLCMVTLASCGEQRKQVVYEEQGPTELFPTLNKEVFSVKTDSNGIAKVQANIKKADRNRCGWRN